MDSQIHIKKCLKSNKRSLCLNMLFSTEDCDSSSKEVLEERGSCFVFCAQHIPLRDIAQGLDSGKKGEEEEKEREDVKRNDL